MKKRHQSPIHRSTNQLPPEKVAQILAALEINSNASQVARQVGGVTHVTVWRYAKAAGIELKAGKAVQRRHAKPAEMRARVIAALEADPNARDAARQVGGIGHASVRKMAQARGIELRRYNRLPAAKVAEIAVALKNNPNIKGIARTAGVDPATVRKIARAEGIVLAPGRPRTNTRSTTEL